jgi:Glycosyl hydrolases family 2, TIM barrel domain/Glycosyl hydrolases family 2, sugar binding domain/Glycosyl hydrolases family 2
VPSPRAIGLLGAVVLAAIALAGCAFSTHGADAPGAHATAATTSLRPPAAISLDAGWRYAPDRGDVGLEAGWSSGPRAPGGGTAVTVPNTFNPNVIRSQDGGRVGWYWLRFTAPSTQAQRSWAVRFEAVRRTAEVWLNGRKLGSNSNPYAPFTLAARSLRPGASNLLVVRVDNLVGPASFPQDWWNWGGIVGDVTLVPIGRLALSDLGVMPQLRCGLTCASLLVQGVLRNVSTAPLRGAIEVSVTAPSGTSWTASRDVGPALAPGASRPVSFRVSLPSRPELWSPSDPALYRVQVATAAGDRVEQVNSLQVGMRTVKVSHGILYLNGRRLWLHGASIHEDVQGSGASLTDGDVNTIVSQLRSLGANITRTHYLLSEDLLDALDQAGIMVWSQPPVDHADAKLASDRGRKRALSLLRDTILGERSHPSVVVDSVANELSPTPDAEPGTRSYLHQAIAMARRLDPVAVVGLDTYCYTGFPAQRIYAELDVLGIDSYFGWYTGFGDHSIASFDRLEPFLRQSRARYPRQALVISEFGAEGVFDGAASAKGSYEFQSDYLRRTYAVLARLPFMNGAIYWALRDFAVAPGWTGGVQFPRGYDTDGLNHKGLIAYDGTEKPAFAVASQLFARTPPFVR